MSPDNETTRVIAGRYRLDAQVGRGGMGVVWRGEDQMLGRDVALKRIGLMPGGDQPDLVRAEREAQLAARLNHPHIVAVFDLVAEGDAQWLVMEYVAGRTLGQLVADEGPLDPEQARVLLAQAADALAAAHAAGILHRDVKPSNILVRHDGSVKLTDFGIARATADVTLTQTGLVTGSPAYLAPEVASGGRASAASDVWALGATLFHALEGRPPYDMGGNVMAGMYQIVHGPEPRSDRAGRLAGLLEHTMVKDPESRWSMEQVRAALQDPRRLDDGRTGAETVATSPVDATRVAPAAGAAAAAAPVSSLVSRATERHHHEDDDEDYDAEPTWTTVDTGTGGPAGAPAGAPPTIAPPPSERSSRRRRRLLVPLLVGGLLLVLLLGIGLSGLFGGGDDETAGEEPSAAASGSGSESGSESPSGSPSESASPSESSDAPAAEDLEAFASDYVAAAAGDPRSSFESLTPAFKRQSGGFSGYDSFWGQIESGTVSDVSADPEELTVTYTVSYVRTDGSTTSPEQVTLQLVENDGTFLIDGEV